MTGPIFYSWMSRAIVLLPCVLMLSVFGEDILFRASFNDCSTAADFAAGKAAAASGGIAADLSSRKHPDVGGGQGNALTLTTPEYLAWPAPRNFRPDRGTVSFWVKPVNYSMMDMKNFQVFFQVISPGYEFLVYKFWRRASDLSFRLKIGKDPAALIVVKVLWNPGEWHKVDVTWSPYGMAVYIDGRIGVPSEDFKPAIDIDPPFDIPNALDSGVFALNYSKGWNPHADGRVTAFDDVEIRSRPMTAAEVFAAFAARRPDLAKGPPPTPENLRPAAAKLSYVCRAADRVLSVRLDLAATELAAARDVPVSLALADKADGKIVLRRDVVFPESDSTVDFPFGDAVAQGRDYELTAEVSQAKIVSKVDFRVPDFSFLKARLAVDETVPSPWTKIVREGECTFSLLDRTYVFGQGPMPERIVSRGQELLSTQPAFVFGGTPVAWGKSRLVAERGDRVEMESEGSCGGVNLVGRTELWFDGFCRVTVDVSPKSGAARIESLRLCWTMPREASRYILTPTYRPWNGDSFKMRFDVEDRHSSILWLTGVESGLAWWCSSEANWVRGDSDTDICVVRDAKGTTVSMDIISKPVTLAKTARYEMAFQGTPSKRPDPIYRSYRYGAGKDCQFNSCGWKSASGRYAPDNMRHWTSFCPTHPKDFEQFIAKKKRAGMDELVYSMPARISTLDTPWDYFGESWRIRFSDMRAWSLLDETTGKKGLVMPCCGHTGVADWHLANVQSLFERYPLLKGLYFDLCAVVACGNTLHGDGGVDAFGKRYLTSTAMHLRDYFLRVAKLCRQYGRIFHVHNHNAYIPFVHSLADACWPGEEQYYGFIANPRNHYIEGVAAEEYQSAWNPEIQGMGVLMIPQPARVKSLKPEMVAKDPDAFFSRRSISGQILPALLHGFEVKGVLGEGHPLLREVWAALRPLGMEKARFHGYWYDSPAKSAAASIRVSGYTWDDGSFLLIIGNVGRDDIPVGTALDWSKLGGVPVRLTELLSKRQYDESGLAAHVLPSHAFMLLRGTATGGEAKTQP